jgi:cytochrome c oxidase subunit 2
LTKRHWLAALTTAVCLAAAAPAQAEGVLGTLGRPVDLSLDGHRGDSLFDFCTIAVSLLFFIMCAVIAWSVLFHRGSHKALYTHGDQRKNLILTAILSSIVFFGVDGTMLSHSYADIQDAFYKFPTEGENPVKIEVLAQQWAWNFRYPGPDGKFNTPDDILTLNEMHVPVDRPVLLKMQSKDVIHSFYLPNFRVKQDAFPGSVTKMWFQARGDSLPAGQETAFVEIGCAQHCGTNHYKMKGTLVVHTKDSYETWHREAAEDGQRRFSAEDAEAQWGWDWQAEGKLTEMAAPSGEAAPKHGEE